MNVGASVQDILTRHLENVKAKVSSQMQTLGRNASGQSVASLRVEVSGDTGTLYGSKSFFVMQRGKGPGKGPKGFVEIIKQWIKDKGIAVTPIPTKTGQGKYTPEERGLRSIAGAIAYTILKKGTRLHRNNGYDDIYDTAIEEEIKLMGDEMLEIASLEVMEVNKTL